MALTKLNLTAYNYTVPEFTRPGDSRSRWDLNPSYQRGDVWDIQRRISLVESLLRGIPIGAVYLNVRGVNHDGYVEGVHAAVVDGRQRITTLHQFVDDEFAVPADWFAPETNPRTGDVEVYFDETCGLIDFNGTQVEGVLYSGLTRLGKHLINTSTIAVCQANVNTVAEEAAIYTLVNFGGVEQTPDDKARAEAIAGTNP